jgi:hypothetical protein
VTDQLLGGPLATKGWLVYPATNRFVMFDGKYLHGKHSMGSLHTITRFAPASEQLSRHQQLHWLG